MIKYRRARPGAPAAFCGLSGVLFRFIPSAFRRGNESAFSSSSLPCPRRLRFRTGRFPPSRLPKRGRGAFRRPPRRSPRRPPQTARLPKFSDLRRFRAGYRAAENSSGKSAPSDASALSRASGSNTSFSGERGSPFSQRLNFSEREGRAAAGASGSSAAGERKARRCPVRPLSPSCPRLSAASPRCGRTAFLRFLSLPRGFFSGGAFGVAAEFVLRLFALLFGAESLHLLFEFQLVFGGLFGGAALPCPRFF